MTNSNSLVLVALLGVILKTLVNGLDNGLALTPPMGWLTWERYRCDRDCRDDPINCMNETLVMNMAKVMHDQGYVKAGYNYITIDDCWMAPKRDNKLRLQSDPIRFPSGIKALADFVHSLGMKFGIYEDFGTGTCQGLPGSEFFLKTDADTFAEWGVDLLKLDGCNSHTDDMKYGYPIMGQFLNLTGRPILYSCSWPAYIVGSSTPPNYETIAKYCNMWRNYGDMQDSWDSVYSIVDYYAKNTGNFTEQAGPGQWNDPDMLIVGDFGLSYDQERAQMGMWCMMASPLFMSVDLRNIRPKSKALLLNKNLLAINQDPLGKQAKRISFVDKIGLWSRPLAKNGTFAVALLNSDNQGIPRIGTFAISDVTSNKLATYDIYDAFENKFVGTYNASEKYSCYVNPTGIQMFTLKQK